MIAEITRRTGTLHTSTKARLTFLSVTIQIHIRTGYGSKSLTWFATKI